MAVSLHCLTASTNLPPVTTSPTQLAALTFSGDGRYAAFAVRPKKKLSHVVTGDEASFVFIANVRRTDGDAALMATAGDRPAPPTPTAPAATSAAAPYTLISGWSIAQVLTGGHETSITALAWCTCTGALLSASVDRAVCVWTPAHGHAAPFPPHPPRDHAGSSSVSVHHQIFHVIPQLVMLSSDAHLSLTNAAWSAAGTKLYLGTADGVVAVGRYDAAQKWWICRLLDGHDISTKGAKAMATTAMTPAGAALDLQITSLAPHPLDNAKLAVAHLEGTVQVLSTYMKAVDGALTTLTKSYAPHDDVKAALAPFGYTFFSFSSTSWVHGLAWNSSGQLLAAVSHDSCLHLWKWGPSAHLSDTHSSLAAEGTGGHRAVGMDDPPAVHTVKLLRHLPFLRCTFVSEGVLVTGGFDGRVHVFTISSTAAGTAISEVEDDPGCPSVDMKAAESDARVSVGTMGARGRSSSEMDGQRQDLRKPLCANAAVAGAITTAAAPKTEVAVAPASLQSCDAAQRQPLPRRASPHASPIQLLERIPNADDQQVGDGSSSNDSGGGSSDSPVAAASHMRRYSMIASSGSDGQVHLWQLREASR